MHWMLMPLRRYAEFIGRSRPREYWMYILFLVLGSIVLSVIDTMAGLSSGNWYSSYSPYDDWGGAWGWSYYSRGGWLTLIFCLVNFLPWLAVTVRRLHDSDRSAWWLLIGLVPFFGGLVLLVFMIWSGTRGPNRFGPDPVVVDDRPVLASDDPQP